MITREELNDKTPEQIQSLLQADIQNYAAMVETVDSEEKVLQLEEEIMDAMTKNEERMAGVVYTLPESCTFDNQTFSKNKVSEYIVDFLDRQEVEWSYTLGLYEMVSLWKQKDLQTIGYGAYDSILRLLGGFKYKGFEAWKKILVVNAFLENCHEEYVRDYGYIVYLSQLHNALLEALKKFNPEPVEEAGE